MSQVYCCPKKDQRWRLLRREVRAAMTAGYNHSKGSLYDAGRIASYADVLSLMHVADQRRKAELRRRRR